MQENRVKPGSRQQGRRGSRCRLPNKSPPLPSGQGLPSCQPAGASQRFQSTPAGWPCVFPPPHWAPPRAAMARVLLAPPGAPRPLSQQPCSCFLYNKAQNHQRLRRKNLSRRASSWGRRPTWSSPHKAKLPKEMQEGKQGCWRDSTNNLFTGYRLRKAGLHFFSRQKACSRPCSCRQQLWHNPHTAPLGTPQGFPTSTFKSHSKFTHIKMKKNSSFLLSIYWGQKNSN